MTTVPRTLPTTISAVVSDVDGTLVTDDKTLTPATVAAVARLRSNDIAFAIVSSRPPRGLRMVIDALGITTPVAGYNGGLIATPGLLALTQHLLLPAIARQVVDVIVAHGAEAWVFSGEDWLAQQPEGAYVDLEQRTIGYPPHIVAEFGGALDSAVKIVAVSNDFGLLDKLELHARAVFAEQATVARSQRYYLDFTHPLANKGVALSELAKLLAIPVTEIAVLGDGGNDVAMFGRSGLSIAMGNASPDVQRAADFVTDHNSRDGFAKAIDKFVLGGSRLNPSASGSAFESHTANKDPMKSGRA
ncbi:MAG TPA: Cof-type HAD-IIB family hydrolase [Pseudolabrys sp.]